MSLQQDNSPVKVLAIAIFFLAGIGINRIPPAHAMTMNELKAQFQEETGKSWKMATTDEKHDFVQKTTEHTQVERDQKKDGGGGFRKLLLGATIEARTQYEKKYGQSWDDATPKEQEAFLSGYKKQQREEKQRKDQEQSIKQREETARKQAEIIRKEQQKRQKEEAAAAAKRAAEEKKRASQRKLSEALERIRREREELQQRRR